MIQTSTSGAVYWAVRNKTNRLSQDMLKKMLYFSFAPYATLLLYRHLLFALSSFSAEIKAFSV